MSTSVAEPTWFGQPRGLTILFLTQMWELFSYYGMRTLLVYYMTKQLLFAQDKASFVYGTYTAMAYFTPIIGGAIADRWLGKRNAVVLGGSIMAVGHFVMAFEPMFYLALATIALGNGLFLPSLPSQINDLYKSDDPRRGGRTMSIMSASTSAAGSPWLRPAATRRWHYGFAPRASACILGRSLQRRRPRTAAEPRPGAFVVAPAGTRSHHRIGDAARRRQRRHQRPRADEKSHPGPGDGTGGDPRVSVTIPSRCQSLNPRGGAETQRRDGLARLRSPAANRAAAAGRRRGAGARPTCCLRGDRDRRRRAGRLDLGGPFFVVLTFGELYVCHGLCLSRAGDPAPGRDHGGLWFLATSAAPARGGFAVWVEASPRCSPLLAAGRGRPRLLWRRRPLRHCGSGRRRSGRRCRESSVPFPNVLPIFVSGPLSPLRIEARERS